MRGRLSVRADLSGLNEARAVSLLGVGGVGGCAGGGGGGGLGGVGAWGGVWGAGCKPEHDSP